MSFEASHDGAGGMAPSRPEDRAHDHVHGHAGPFWKRAGRRVRRGLHAGILEAQAVEMDSISQQQGRGGELTCVITSG